MAYLLLNKTGKKVGDKEMVKQCTSAIFNYQVIGVGAVVEFTGSNKPNANIDNDAHWEPIVTITAGTADTEPFRQHTWNQVRYKVTSGNNVEIYVSSGVSG